MRKIILWGILGAVGGICLGEFYPSLLSNGFLENLGANISQPFSPYRNQLAVQFGFWCTLLGLAVRLILNSVQSYKFEKPSQTRKPQQPKWWVWLLIGFLIFISLLVFFNIFGITTQNKSAENVGQDKPITITAQMLAKEYDLNGVAADDKYKGKLLAITGKVSKVENILGAPTVEFEINSLNYKSVNGVQADVSNSTSEEDLKEIRNLKPGSKVTIDAICDGLSLINVNLHTE